MLKTDNLNINDEREVRLKKLDDLLDLGINPYPSKGLDHISVKVALEEKEGTAVVVSGRLMSKREMGKLYFGHLEDETGKVQIVFKQDEIGKDNFKLVLKKIDLGDILNITGERFLTQKGEQSILVKEWILLSKALRPLPDKFHGLQDEELRLRKRYLDFIANPELRQRFYRKSRFWQSMREFLIKEGFLEVETPVLESTAGGADATPFATHHNALDMYVYLRISMGELWQKRLMVAGFEKTFEIGRQFRNEGMSREHLQDYTQMEFYWAYANYEDSMKLVERMYKYVIEETFGTLKFDIGNFKGIDLSKKWEKVDYAEEVKKQTGVDIQKSDEKELKKKLDELKIKYEDFEGKGRLIDSLWKYCRKNIAGPVFLIHHPVDVSPLAKRHQTLHNATERYQVIIAGSEIGNGYSELNDPVDQAERFVEQARMREAGDSEAQMHDTDFVEALEHGMPPTSGFGVSERLFSFLENQPIRECVMFPLMRPEHHEVINKQEVKKSETNFLPLPMDREAAWKLVKKYNDDQALLNHYLESEAVMKALAKKFGEDVEYWGMLGLLHDLDWQMTKANDKNTHGTKSPDMLREAGFPEDFIEIIVSHIYGCDIAEFKNKKRTRQIEHALAAAETVTGLVHAASLMRSEGVSTLEVKSLKKKFKDKRFAAGVDREVVRECEKLGMGLDEFFDTAIGAIREIANEVGLGRRD